MQFRGADGRQHAPSAGGRRVLHVTPYFAPAFQYGGPPRSVLGLCRGLKQSGVDLEVFTTSAGNGPEIESGVTISSVYDGIPVRYFPPSFPKRFFAATGLTDSLREALPQVDLVHLHGLWTFPVWVGARECMLRDVPFVVSTRGMLDQGSMKHHRWRKEVCYRIHEKRYLQRAALLHATSKSEALSLASLALGSKITCIPNGVSVPSDLHASSVRARLDLLENCPLVLFLGRLHPTKRLDLLIEATALARKKDPRLRLLIAGPPDGEGVERMLARVGDWCHWIREVSENEKWAVLSQADVLVLCSDSESFGLSVLEALAVGTPVVVTRTCPWDIIEEVRCGLWIEQQSEKIAEGILAVIKDPDEARAMGGRGRQLVQERYDWAAIGREMAREYERALLPTH